MIFLEENSLHSKGTGKLWVQYLWQVDILRLFIRAERSGDWELHLKCVRSMLLYLHAARHIHRKYTCVFVAAFPLCLKLCNALEELSGIEAGSSEQHVELRDSRRTRDACDVAVLLSWLKEHSPWEVDCLRSLASDVENDSINCGQAKYVDLGAIKRIIGSTFGEVKLMQKNSVKPLSEVARSILIRDDALELNSHQLFMWIVYVMKTQNDLKHYLSDADTLIVKRALELVSVGNNVTVVASVTDIAVMLLARATDDIELRVLSPGTDTKCDKVYNVRGIQEKIWESKDSVLFCRAVTGCDTTSASLGKGKKKAWKILQRPGMRNVTKVFNNPESMKEEVCAAGEKVIQYTRSIAKQPVAAAFELATLPPSAACAEHSLLTYYQQWCDNIPKSSRLRVETGWRILGSNTDLPGTST
ncbi:hypothetical protein PR048_032939 [Dryococelus australis]|uniref:Uncharacterized protein n=1 Tax=Dryococelus australis TaxID=614101 RepID=A0ABQ9G4T9_9NEOP|nr:hypothetical protein PR048_032939 [Dryococelus australis]